MNLEKRIKRNLLGTAGDLPSSTWPAEWKRSIGEGFSGTDLKFVSNNDIQRRFVHLYGEAQAAIEFALPIDLRLTAQPGYQVRFLYQPTQLASENPRVAVYFNDGAHFWTRELQTSTAKEDPRDWLICDDSIELNDEITQPKATLAFESGLFDPFAATADATTDPERDQPIAQEPGWPVDPGDLHFSGKALGTEVSPELAAGVTVFVHLKPLALSTSEPMPELSGVNARYWVEKEGRAYMPICRGAGVHHLILPVAEDCGWAGGGVHVGTSAYVSFTDPNEAGQAGLHVAPTDPDADDDAQHIAKTWEIRNDADEDDLGVNGRTATLRFESVYHADPYEGLACIVGPFKLDITDHGQPDYWPSVEDAETIDLRVKVHYAVSGNPEPGVTVEWHHGSDLLETLLTGEDGEAILRYQPSADATVIAVVDSPYRPEADTQAFVVKTIPTRLWGQFEISVDAAEISPDDHLWILPGQTYQLTLKPRADSVLIGQDLAFSVDPAQRFQLEPAGDRPLTASGLSWSITTAADASGDFALRLDCIRFKQPPILNGGVNDLPALSIAEAPGPELDPLAAVETLTAVVPHYDGMRGTDKIRVTWTGAAGSPEEGSHTTEPVEVGTVGEKSIPLPVALIAYSLGRSVTVSYTVTPDGGSESPSSDLFHLAIQVIAEEELLVAKPRMLEAANLSEGAEFDVRNLTADATLRIDSWPHIAHGQRIWLHVEGTKADGSNYQKQWNGTGNWVGADWYRDGYSERDVSHVDLQALRDGSTLTLKLKASFNKSHDEAEATLFPQRTYTIRATLNLSAPSIKQATGNAPSQQLNPVEAKDALTVVIPDYGVLPGDQVSVTWTGADGDGSCVVPAQAVPGNREIDIPVEVIAYNLGSSVTVTYTIARDSVPTPSAALTLMVQIMPVEALEPSKPRILQAASDGNGSELDVNGVSADVWVRVDSWPHVAHEQRTWLSVDGINIDGSAYRRDLWQGHRHWVSPEWYNRGYGERHILLDDLLALRDGSALKLEFKASFNKSQNVADAVTFPLRTYTVKLELITPTLDSVKDANNKEVQEGDLTLSTAFKLSGKANRGQRVEIFEGDGASAKSQGRTRADSITGIWEHDVTLREGERRLYAKALYLTDGSVHSNVREFTIVELFTPTLGSVENANGQEIQEGDLTASTTLKLSGQASKGQKVEIYDGHGGSAVSKGQATADPITRLWAHDITVVEGPRRLYAKALYPTDGSVYSNVRELTVVELVTPTLDSVKGANNQEVQEDDCTVSTTLKLSGQASKGQKVEIFDGNGASAVSKGQTTADPVTGLWSHDINVVIGKRRLYAKSLYHSGGSSVYSNVRECEVVALVTPTLDGVIGGNNQEVREGDLIVSTRLKLSGQASKGQKVEIFDGSGSGAVSKGQATAESATGVWTLDITVNDGARRLYARSLYHSGSSVFSNVRKFTVVPLVTPTLDSVKGSDGREIPHGGSTTSTELRLSGRASRGQKVEIFDIADLASKGQATSDTVSGNWTRTINVTEGGRLLYAVSLYHSGAPVHSNIRQVNVRP